MSDFVRSARKSELNIKSLDWTDGKINEFYGGFATDLATKVAFERVSTGYIAATPGRINLVQITTGDRYVYQTTNGPTWEAYTKLYNTFSSDNVKLENPLYRDTSTSKEYLEIRTPNREIGLSISAKMSKESTLGKDVYETYLLGWIDAVAEILPIVKPIAQEYNIGLPKALFYPGNYLKDSSSSYFTNLETDWNVSLTSFYADTMSAFLEKLKSNVSHTLPIGNIETLEQRARSTWT